MKKYNIYKTTNLVNGKFYWGVHDSIDENDGYLGSGTVLRKAIKKYGKDSFRRVTKLLYNAAREAYKDEGFIVNKAMVENPMSYNSHPGGKGGSLPGKHAPCYGRTGDKHPMFGKTGKNNPNYGSKRTQEQKRNIKASVAGENNYWYGKKRPEHGAKMLGENNPMSITNRLKRRSIEI